MISGAFIGISIFNKWFKNSVDDFKFIIKFNTALEKYCESQIKNENIQEEDMPTKIKTCHFSTELENKLIKINALRNKVTHENYNIIEEDKELYKCIYPLLMKELFLRHLSSLQLSSIKIPEEHNMLDLNDIQHEMWVELHRILRNLPTYPEFNRSKSIKEPVFEKLGFPVRWNTKDC